MARRMASALAGPSPDSSSALISFAIEGEPLSKCTRRVHGFSIAGRREISAAGSVDLASSREGGITWIWDAGGERRKTSECLAQDWGVKREGVASSNHMGLRNGPTRKWATYIIEETSVLRARVALHGGMETITAVAQFLVLLMVCSGHVVLGSFNWNETDRLSLIEFKEANSRDPQQVMMSWNDRTHFCNWEGVLCRMKNPCHVISLDLTNRGLVGNISPLIGNITLLKYLHLYLSNNSLQGEIPNFSNCSSLAVLWLNGNKLVGQVPAYNSLLPRVEELQISDNDFIETIPPSISNSTTLIRLGIMNNKISGEIPIEVGEVSHATRRFQQSLLNISSLVILNLASNYLNGELPSNLGNSFSNLQKFGSLALKEIFNISTTIQIGLPSNSLYGPLLLEIGNALQLQYLYLLTNNLSSIIPETIVRIHGNKGLCGGPIVLQLPTCPMTPPSPTTKHTRSIVLKVVSPVGIVLTLGMTIIVVFLLCRKRNKKNLLSLHSFGGNLLKVSYTNLARATNGFSGSNLIGRGRCSSMYKGELFQDGNVVVIKVFSLEIRGLPK
ncbi:hypothetical protein U9M48_004895, partial [Paspalum notatum var. saurae]